MVRPLCWAVTGALLLAGWLFPSAPAAAVTPQVYDRGEFFSAAAVQKANDEISRIKRQYHKDVIVSTYREIPAERRKNLGEENNDRFFADWVRDYIEENGIDGVVILISRERGHIQVGMTDDLAKRGTFTASNRGHLRDLLVSEFKAKRYDEGLVAGVDYIRQTFAAHVAQAPVATGGGGAHHGGGGPNVLGWLCPLLVILGLVWLFIGLIRAFTGGGGYGRGYGAGGYGPGYGPGYGGGGGGFMSGLLGGMFGAVAGNWMYHNFFGGGGSSWGGSAYGGSPDVGPGGVSSSGGDFGDDSAGGGDYGGGGGDYGTGGGDTGGGDFGGGDFGGGGGDFGGGDFGGGGGDFGGGGGDYGGGGGDF